MEQQDDAPFMCDSHLLGAAPVPLIARFVPQVWAETLLTQFVGYDLDTWREHLRTHEERYATDPAYACAYDLRMAALETERSWEIFYDHWFPPEEDDE